MPYYVGSGGWTVWIFACVEFSGKEFVVPETGDGDLWTAGGVGDLAFDFVGAFGGPAALSKVEEGNVAGGMAFDFHWTIAGY